jgi:ankyrin repeat protein
MQQTGTTRYNPRYTISYNNPDKQPAIEVVNKILLNVASGKYFDVKKAIAQEKSFLNVFDSSRKSILHYVLLNSELSKTEKYDLIKSVIDLGAPIDIPDSNGVRPIHLAASQQNTKVVKLLLDKKADPNSHDNNYMTPLHYAVNPEKKSCPDVRETELIKTPITSNFRTDELFDVIFDKFKNDEFVIMYITHITNMFKNGYVYQDQLTDKENLSKLIGEVIGERSSIDLNESKNKKLVDFAKSIQMKTKTELANTHSKIDFKEHTENGWGPTMNNKKDENNNVIPFPSLNSAFNHEKQKIDKSMDSVVANLSKKMKALNQKVDKMHEYQKKTTYFFKAMHDIHNFMYTTKSIIKTELFPKYEELNNAIQELLIGTLVEGNSSIFNLQYWTITDNIIDVSNEQSELGNDVSIDLQKNPYDLLDDNEYWHGKNDYYYGDNDTLQNVIGTGVIVNSYYNQIKKIIDGVSERINRMEVHIRNIGQGHKDAIYAIGDIQLLIVNICHILLIIEIHHLHISSIINEFKKKYINQNLGSTLSNYIEWTSSIATVHKQYFSEYEISSDILSKIEIDNDDIVVPANSYDINIFINPGTRKYIDHTKGSIQTYPGDDEKLNITASSLNEPEEQEEKVFAINIDVNNIDVNNTYEYVRLNDQTSNFVGFSESADVKNFTYGESASIKFHNYLDGFVKEGGFRTDTGDITRVNGINIVVAIYVAATELHKVFVDYVDVYSQVNGLKYIRMFNNDFDEDILMDELNDKNKKINKIEHALVSKLKRPEKLPDTIDFFSEKIKSFGNNITNIINNFGYKFDSDNYLYTVDKYNRNVNRKFGIISTLIQDDTGIKKGVLRVYSQNHYDKDDNVEDIATILGSVFDHQIYMIRLILIMHLLQNIANEYVAKKNPIHETFSELQENIRPLSEHNPFGTLLALSAKMIDDIYLSTIDNISNIGATNYVQYLIKGPDTSNTLMDIPKELIAKPDDRVRLKDNELLLSVVSSGAMVSMGNIRIFEQSAIEKSKKMTRLIDHNVMENSNDMCYSIDEDVVIKLLNAGANPNTPERSGETPLSLAVLIQNEEIISTLIQSGAKVILDKNGSNKNIYKFSFSQLLNNIESSPIYEIDDLNSRVENHLRIKSGMTRLFSNSKIILGMAAYLLMHQITINVNTYPNMWSRSQQKDILELIGFDSVEQEILPLANVEPRVISETIEGYATYNQLMNTYKNKLVAERDILLRLNNSKRNLEIELKEIQSGQTQGNNFRESEIGSMLSEIKQQITLVTSRVKSLKNEFTGKKNYSDNGDDRYKKMRVASSKISKLLTGNKARIVTNIYDSFFNILSDDQEVGDSEYITYIKIWEILLARPKDVIDRDHTQMIRRLMNYVVEQGEVSPDVFKDSYTNISELYERVLSRYGRDLIELMPYLAKDGESYYDQNYVLKQIYMIIFHVFKHTMSVNFIHTVAQLMARRDRGATEGFVTRNIYNSMVTSDFFRHCIEVIPRQVIKIVCKIASAEKDPDISMTVTEALNKAIDLLLLSTFDGVDKATVESAKELVVPYFASYMEVYTAEMHQLLVKQVKMLITQGRLFKIIDMLAGKTLLETTHKK